jgi:hypothetical protein
VTPSLKVTGTPLQNRTTQRRPVPVLAIEEQRLRRRLVYRRLRLEDWNVNHGGYNGPGAIRGSRGPSRAVGSAHALAAAPGSC